MNERSVLGIVVYQNSKQVQVHACALAWAGGGGGEVIIVPNNHNTNNMAPQNISVPSLHIWGGSLTVLYIHCTCTYCI